MGIIWNPSGGGGGGSGTVTGGSSEGSGQAVFDASNSTSTTLVFKSLTSSGSTLTFTNTSTTVNGEIASGWAGQSSITTVGTIGTGVWNGTPIPISYGGTGQTTAANAIVALGGLPIAGGTMTGNLILNADPTAALGAVTKEYADAISQGLDVKDACYAATTVSGGDLGFTYVNGVSGVGATLTGPSLVSFTVDGTSPGLNSRILVKNQTNTYQNGIYTLTTVGSGSAFPVLTRSTDYNQPSEIAPGDLIPVTNGTVNSVTSWVETATVSSIGSGNPITFSQFTASPSSYLAVANNLSDVASASTSRTNLGLAIGTNVEAWSSTLDAVAGGTYTGATSITTLGTITTGIWSGTAVAVNNGGTGDTSATAYMPVCGGTTSTGALQSVATGTQYYPLCYNTSSSLPTFQLLHVSGISATGTPSSTTYLRGDGSWSTPASGGGSTNLGQVYPIVIAAFSN